MLARGSKARGAKGHLRYCRSSFRWEHGKLLRQYGKRHFNLTFIQYVQSLDAASLYTAGDVQVPNSNPHAQNTAQVLLTTGNWAEGTM